MPNFWHICILLSKKLILGFIIMFDRVGWQHYKYKFSSYLGFKVYIFFIQNVNLAKHKTDDIESNFSELVSVK